jgi:hypothetical protein
VGHLAVAWVDAERMDLPDVAIGGVNVVAAALLHLARRDDVYGFLLRDPRDRAALDDRPARVSPAGGSSCTGTW